MLRFGRPKACLPGVHGLRGSGTHRPARADRRGNCPPNRSRAATLGFQDRRRAPGAVALPSLLFEAPFEETDPAAGAGGDGSNLGARGAFLVVAGAAEPMQSGVADSAALDHFEVLPASS